jgi:hypothetical protein
MKFKHRLLINQLAIASVVVGLANGALFCFNRQLYTALVASLCILFGFAYLIILRIHVDSE